MSMNDISQLMLQKFLARGIDDNLDQVRKITRLVPRTVNLMANIATDVLFSASLHSTALAANINQAQSVSPEQCNSLIDTLFVQNPDNHGRKRVVEGIFMVWNDHDLRPIRYKTEALFKNKFFNHVTSHILHDDQIIYGRNDTFNTDDVLYHTENPAGFSIMHYRSSDMDWLHEKAATNLSEKHALDFNFAECEMLSAQILQKRAMENAKKLQMMIYTSPHQIILSGPTIEKNIDMFKKNGLDISTDKLPDDAMDYFPEIYSNIPGQTYFTID